VLTKLPIALASALTALIGFRMAEGGWGWPCLLLLGSTLLLSMGAAALNEIQERDFDARMERTLHRPLPSGTLPLKRALAGALVLALVGLGGLLLGFGPGPAGVGLGTLVWYNGVYTPLKRHTPWVVLPGALVGALPPFIGWMAAGRGPLAAPILVVGLLIFLWQVPHFWALVLIYSRDYAQAGFPTLEERLSPHGVARLTLLWIALLVASSALLSWVGLVRSLGGVALLGTAGLALLWAAKGLDGAGTEARWVFHAINLYALMLALVLLIDPCLR